MDIDLNQGGASAKATGVEPPPHWPQGVGPISLDGLGRLGVSDDNLLYWDGKRLQVERRFSNVERIIGWLVAASSILVAVATISMAVTDYLRFLKGD